MDRLPLSPNLSRKETVLDRSEDAVLLSEAAARFMELMTKEGSETKAFGWIARMYAIGTLDPEAFRMVMALSTGDLSQITYTYSQLGKTRHRSKQAQQQATERVIRVLNSHFPQLAKVIVEIKHITAQIEPGKPHEHAHSHPRLSRPAPRFDDAVPDGELEHEMV